MVALLHARSAQQFGQESQFRQVKTYKLVEIGVICDSGTEYDDQEGGQKQHKEIEPETLVELARNLAYAPDVVEHPFHLKHHPQDGPEEHQRGNDSHSAATGNVDYVARLFLQEGKQADVDVGRESQYESLDIVAQPETVADGKDECQQRNQGEGDEIAEGNALEAHAVLGKSIYCNAYELREGYQTGIALGYARDPVYIE